jgi:DNA-binding transcriptional MocR family regulator
LTESATPCSMSASAEDDTGEHQPSVTARLLERVNAAQGDPPEYVTSTRTLAAAFGSSRRQIQRIIGKLEKRGVLERDYVTTETGQPIGTRLRRIPSLDAP